MTDPGTLNRRLTVEEPVETPDGAGGVIRSFAAGATLWASVMPLSAREILDAARLGMILSHRIVVRAGPVLSVRHRLREGGRIFCIASVRPQDARETFLEIAVEERLQ